MQEDEYLLRLMRSRTSRHTGQALADKTTDTLCKLIRLYTDGTLVRHEVVCGFFLHCFEYMEYCDKWCYGADYFQQWLSVLPRDVLTTVVADSREVISALNSGHELFSINFPDPKELRPVYERVIQEFQRLGFG
jgi:hypothetical protein